MQMETFPLPELSVFASKALIKAFVGRQETSVTFNGVVLFADMSGYTALAEELCAQGTDGREQLSRILNQTFALYVECIHRAGGEIASFAGDSILAYWPIADVSLTKAMAAAESCAKALHDMPCRHTTNSFTLPDLHIGIAAGRLWAAQLGGVDDVWYQILAGPAAKSAFDAGNKARSGETVMVHLNQDLDVSPDEHRGLEDAPGIYLPATEDSPSSSAIEKDHGLVPRVVREWWSKERLRWLPQVRMICALFVKIDHLPPEQDDNLEIYQRAIVTMQRAFRAYSASSGTLVADDKGLVFKLYFGMPYNTHRNDSAQALQSALAIRRGIRSLGLDCSAGLDSGEGICMPIGGMDRLEYTTIGRFSHRAARLMGTPVSDILCTKNVASLAGRDIQLAKQLSIRLKGISQPVDVFRAEAPVSVDAERHQLVGRQTELAQIYDRLDRLRSGQGSILSIVGDAGIGKTALIEDLIDTATSSNLRVLIGRSTMSEVVVSFRPWRSIFMQLLDLESDVAAIEPDGSGIASRLNGLPENVQRHLSLLNAVIPGLIKTESGADNLFGKARVDATLTLLSRLFRFLVPPGFILILEDCHWMDSASWQLLEWLIATSPDMLVVLTSRPHPDTQALAAIRALPRFQELLLQPLDAAAIEKIISASVPIDTADPENQTWREEAIEFAMGNPLFAKEYAYLKSTRQRAPMTSLSRRHGDQDQGVLLRSASQRQNTDDALSPSFSVTLQSLITSRLDSLRPPELLVLKAASVIGSQFDLPLLEYVAPDRPGPKQLLKTIADLVRHHVVLIIDQKTAVFRFQHDLIREVVYGQLTGEQKKLLHNRTAEAIEEVHSQHLPSQFAMLADHWSKADNSPHTIKYAELAAEQAIRSGGYVEAERLLGLCFEQADRDSRHRVPMARRIRWYRLSADAQFGLGNLAERARDAETALRIFGKPRANSRPRLIGGALASLASWNVGRLTSRLGFARKRQSLELSLEIARIYRHSAAVAWFSNDPVTMTAHSIDALHHAEQATPSDVLAGASVEFGGILGLLGFRSLGRAMMLRAQRIAEEIEDLAILAYVHLLICLYEVGAGNWEGADRSSLACEQLCDQIGDRVNWANVQAVRFWSPFYRNDLETAEARAKRLYEQVQIDGNPQHRAWAHRYAALCDLRRKQPSSARRHLEHALEALGGTKASNETLPALGLLALARYRCGDRASAYEAALEGLSLMETVGRPTGHAMLEGYAALTEVAFHALLEDRTSPTWQTAFDQCLSGLNRYRWVFPIGVPRYRIWLGLSQALQGRFRHSRKNLERACDAAKRLGMPWEQDLAGMALEIGPERFLDDLRSQAADSGPVSD